jgi:hypothetical protein
MFRPQSVRESFTQPFSSNVDVTPVNNLTSECTVQQKRVMYNIKDVMLSDQAPVPAVLPTVAELVPPLIARAGGHVARRFVEFFTANLANRNTRVAYGRAATAFFGWCEDRGIRDVSDIQPVHVAAYREHLGAHYSVPTVKQHPAAVRMLFDWLVTGSTLGSNPASAVRGPRHSVSRGATPVLSPHETAALLDSIQTTGAIGLRDRALIALMTYTFARVGSAVQMRTGDYSGTKDGVGFGCTRRTAGLPRCRAITRSHNTSMNILGPPVLGVTNPDRSSAPSAGVGRWRITP